jgi:hypothetical protein
MQPMKQYFNAVNGPLHGMQKKTASITGSRLLLLPKAGSASCAANPVLPFHQRHSLLPESGSCFHPVVIINE